MPHVTTVLDTPRLRLRPHTLDDFTACAAMWADPLVTGFIGGRPFSPEESWTRLLRYAGHWALLHFGYWVLEDKATGRFAGEVGFADYHRDLDASFEKMPEMGWVLVSEFQGRGYATEAIQAALAWGDAHFTSPTFCLIHPDNRPSLRVAAKCGFQELRAATYKGHPTIVLLREPGVR